MRASHQSRSLVLDFEMNHTDTYTSFSLCVLQEISMDDQGRHVEIRIFLGDLGAFSTVRHRPSRGYRLSSYLEGCRWIPYQKSCEQPMVLLSKNSFRPSFTFRTAYILCTSDSWHVALQALEE